MIATPLHARAAAAVADPRVRAAFQLLQDREAEIESDQIRLTLVPAPPFHEEERGRHFAHMVRSLGFSPVVDAIGNVVFPYEETEGNPVIVGAHLDTVFPRDVKLELRRSGRVVRLPGISDNGAGLGASHQTGWTGCIAALQDFFARISANDILTAKKGHLAERLVQQQAYGKALGK